MRKYTYNIIRIFNLLFAILPTLGFYRATVQSDYNWGLLIIHGTGKSEDYKWLVLFALIAWSSFLLERWYKRKWYYAFPFLLFSTSFIVTLFGVLSNNTMTFQGDAWGIQLEVGLFYVLLTFIPLICFIYWMLKDLSGFKPVTARFKTSKFIQLLGCISLSAIILFLFNLGEGGIHSNYDRFAVALTVAQGLLLAYINDSSVTNETRSND